MSTISRRAATWLLALALAGPALAPPAAAQVTQPSIPGATGLQGPSGRSVQSLAIANGRLIATFSDGSTQDAGLLPTGGGAVSSVAGRTGAVTLAPADIAGLAPVASTGNYLDLTGRPTIPPAYTLPAAAAGVLGGVKPGTGITIAGDGTIAATGTSGVSTLNGRSGAVSLLTADVTAALGYAPVNPAALATVATSGAYADLSGKPTIPAAPGLATSGVAGLVKPGTGLSVAGDGTLSASAASGLPAPTAGNTVTSFVAGDLVPINQSGSVNYVSAGTLIGGKTIDQLDPAAALTLTDLTVVTQGGTGVSKRATLQAQRDLIFTGLGSYRQRRLEVSGTVILDGATMGDAVLVFTGPGTVTISTVANLTPAAGVYRATVVADGGDVAFGAGITTTGTATLVAGQVGTIVAYTRSDSTARVFAQTPPAAGGAAPAATLAVSTVTGLTAGGTMTVSGTYANGTPTGLTYKVDGGTATAASTPTISGGTYSFTLTAPAAGAHSIVVTGTGGNTASSSAQSFTTTAAASTIYTYAAATPSTSPQPNGSANVITVEIRKNGVLVTSSNLPAAGWTPALGWGPSSTTPPALITGGGDASGGVRVASYFYGNAWYYDGPAYTRPQTGGTYYLWVTTPDGDKYTNGIPIVLN